MIRKGLVFLLLVLLPLGWPRSATRGAEEDEPKAEPIVQANTAFALDLYGKLREREREGNFVFSPIVVWGSVSMGQLGARGENAEEMAKGLHLGEAGKDPHKAFGALQRGFAGRKDVTLTAANAVFLQKGYPFAEAFVGRLKADYGAEVQHLDFKGAREDACKAINRWAEKATGGRIKDSLSSEELDKLTRLVLSSAIYFKGEWVTRFEKGRTKDAPFHLTAEKSVKVPMMWAEGSKFRLSRRDGYDALEMPYKGDELVMVILLPDAVEGLAALEKKLTVKELTGALGALHAVEAQVRLPRFSLRSDLRLNEPLQSLGMKRAFGGGAADFSGMMSGLIAEPLRLNVVQSAFIDVDEKGTEAGAVAHDAGIGCGEAAAPLRFDADHPFIFLIRDRRSGSILFMGRVTNPKG